MHRQGKCTKLNIIEYMHFVYAQPMSTSHGGGGEGPGDEASTVRYY